MCQKLCKPVCTPVYPPEPVLKVSCKGRRVARRTRYATKCRRKQKQKFSRHFSHATLWRIQAKVVPASSNTVHISSTPVHSLSYHAPVFDFRMVSHAACSTKPVRKATNRCSFLCQRKVTLLVFLDLIDIYVFKKSCYELVVRQKY